MRHEGTKRRRAHEDRKKINSVSSCVLRSFVSHLSTSAIANRKSQISSSFRFLSRLLIRRDGLSQRDEQLVAFRRTEVMLDELLRVRQGRALFQDFFINQVFQHAI